MQTIFKMFIIFCFWKQKFNFFIIFTPQSTNFFGFTINEFVYFVNIQKCLMLIRVVNIFHFSEQIKLKPFRKIQKLFEIFILFDYDFYSCIYLKNVGYLFFIF